MGVIKNRKSELREGSEKEKYSSRRSGRADGAQRCLKSVGYLVVRPM